ncbi:hypothetical protein P43SY_007941 [Pythium insidiosum]|uniref:Palmitoyltransferase n=1 Tax=Pythium insidiosum TaxID=114742 RepID=A0AAD5Q3M7_PYTIN|nr:hypothetical protein P43SY_007941 [Pythium insidiosum]
MRLICAACCYAPADDVSTACDKCSAALQTPSVFDCARLGLLLELQELIAATPDFDVNARELSTNATLLHHAAINSKMRVLEYLVAEFADSVEIDALGGELQTTPLFWAAYHNHIYAVELLLRHGADASFTDEAGFCAFLVAIQRCFPILAAYLVAKGTDIDTRVKGDGQRTALMLLSQRQRFHLDSYRMVLSLGANVDAQDTQGNTALHHAVLSDLGMAVRMLLDRGADPKIPNKDGKTPLDLARTGLDERSLARHLLEEDNQLFKLAQTTSLKKKWLEDNVYKLSFFVPWVMIPAFAWIMVHSHGVVFTFLHESMLFVAAFGLLKLLQRGTYGDKRKAAALMFGINVASVFWLVLAFPQFAAGHASPTFQAFIYGSAAMLLLCLYLTAVTDAGTVFTTYREKIFNIRTLVESKSPSATKLCLTCLHRRPLRAKHCAELNACIAKFDHYCPFVVNAVGAENHHYFLGFLFFAVAAISMELVVCWRFAAAQPDITWSEGVVRGLWSVVHFHPILVCVMLLGGIHVAWIGYLLVFHCYLVMAALTTNEVVKNENLQRAYTRGVVSNVIDFFRLPGARCVDWKAMFRLDDFLEATGVKDKAA